MQFTTYELVKKREEKRHMKDPNVLPLPRRIPIATLAGAVAGVTSALVTYPFQSLGDRLILNVSPCSSFDLFETGKKSHYTLVAMPEFLFCLTKFGCKSLWQLIFKTWIHEFDCILTGRGIQRTDRCPHEGRENRRLVRDFPGHYPNPTSNGSLCCSKLLHLRNFEGQIPEIERKTGSWYMGIS